MPIKYGDGTNNTTVNKDDYYVNASKPDKKDQFDYTPDTLRKGKKGFLITKLLDLEGESNFEGYNLEIEPVKGGQTFYISYGKDQSKQYLGRMRTLPVEIGDKQTGFLIVSDVSVAVSVRGKNLGYAMYRKVISLFKGIISDYSLTERNIKTPDGKIVTTGSINMWKKLNNDPKFTVYYFDDRTLKFKPNENFEDKLKSILKPMKENGTDLFDDPSLFGPDKANIKLFASYNK